MAVGEGDGAVRDTAAQAPRVDVAEDTRKMTLCSVLPVGR